MGSQARVAVAAWVLVVGLTGPTLALQDGNAGASRRPAVVPTGFGASVDSDIERVRKATEAFKDLDRAVAAGYGRDGGDCIANPPQGAMGFHHQNNALLDDRLEVKTPEILVYERLAGGEYRLNGVEYIVPIGAWTRREPPSIMGQPLKKAPRLGIWYLHVWNWEPNPSGLFADWNPNVKCPAAGGKEP